MKYKIILLSFFLIMFFGAYAFPLIAGCIFFGLYMVNYFAESMDEYEARKIDRKTIEEYNSLDDLM